MVHVCTDASGESGWKRSGDGLIPWSEAAHGPASRDISASRCQLSLVAAVLAVRWRSYCWRRPSADTQPRWGRLVLGGDTVLSRGPLARVTVWDVSSGRVVRRLDGDAWNPVFSRDGRLVVGEGGEGSAVIFNVGSGRISRTLHFSGAGPMEPAFRPDARRSSWRSTVSRR